MRAPLWILFPLLAGCASYQFDKPIPEDWDLELSLLQLQQERGVLAPASKILECAAPDPLPVVSYEIGTVSGLGTVSLPIYMNTEGRRSQGGLLFLEYDSKHLRFIDVEPGPAWENADFVHSTINDMVEGHAIFILLGWELTEDGFAYGVPETEDPWAFLVFETVKNGKAKVTWDELPDPPPVFFRRGEMLLDLDDAGRCVWDVVDWYKSSPNSTGSMTVSPGAVKVSPTPAID